MSRRSSSYAASLTVIVVAAVFMGTALFVGGQVRRGGVRYEALFSSSQGLSVGDDVQVAGVPIGTVTRIELDERTDQAKVTFEVMRAIPVVSDSAISVSGGGTGGSAALELSLGRSGQPIPAGGTLSRACPAESLEATIGSFIFGSGLPGSG